MECLYICDSWNPANTKLLAQPSDICLNPSVILLSIDCGVFLEIGALLAELRMQQLIECAPSILGDIIYFYHLNVIIDLGVWLRAMTMGKPPIRAAQNPDLVQFNQG